MRTVMMDSPPKGMTKKQSQLVARFLFVDALIITGLTCYYGNTDKVDQFCKNMINQASTTIQQFQQEGHVAQAQAEQRIVGAYTNH